MWQVFSRTIRSEVQIRSLLGYVALALAPVLLTILVLATKFQGLQTVAALDHAQVARHLAAGDGFVTSWVRPLSLEFRATIAGHPDLNTPPLHPGVLAVFFRLLGPSDKVAAGAGMLLWIGTLWLTFAVARRWYGPRTATLATLFCGANVALLSTALGGLPQPLMAGLALVSVWLAAPPLAADDRAVRTALPGWRSALAGLACALAVLTHYAMGSLALVVAVYLAATQPQKLRSLAWFAAGFLVPVLPWMFRYYSLTHGLGLSLSWCGLLANTGAFPGDSIWRTLESPPQPLLFVVTHPAQVARKVFVGLAQFRGSTLNLLDAVIVFLALAALVNSANNRRWRGWLGVAVISLAMAALASCLFQPEPELLLAWSPLLAIAGAAQLIGWVQRRVGRWSFDGVRVTLPSSAIARRRHEPPRRLMLGRFAWEPRWTRPLVHLAVIGLVVFPLLFFIFVARPGPDSRLRERLRPLAELTPARAVVMTDQPALVAWYADRTAVWLCQTESQLDQMERVLGPVDAVYVTPAVLQLPLAERGDWWPWVTAPRGIYRGLAPLRHMPPNAALRLRPKPSP